MKQLILIRGLSGSGKTTLANIMYANNDNRVMITVDDYFTNDNGEYRFDPNSLKEAHSWCQEETSMAMEDDYEVIILHNTFTRKWEVDPYMTLAHKNEYKVQVVSLYDGGLSDRELSERCIHNIPPHVIQKQRKRWDKDVYREKKNHYPPHNPYRQYPQNDHYPQYPQNNHYQRRNHKW